nr:uncharacterized protein LOC108019557 isoform X3 [Drosophila suzukii]
MNTNEYARDSTWIKPGRQKERYLNPFEAVGRNSVKSCAPDVSDLKYAQTNRGGRLSAAITSFT